MINKTNKILKVISLIFIIIMMVSCFGKSKKEIIKEFKNNNVIIKKKDIDVSFTFPASILAPTPEGGDYHIIELINLKLKTKFVVQSFKNRYYSPEKYIYDELIPLYVLKEYIYDKSIGNNFEEIENTINQYLIDSEKKFNLEQWDNPEIYVNSIKLTNEEKNTMSKHNKCYLTKKYKDEKAIIKYIPKKTRYDELNFSKLFEDYDKYPVVSIYLYNTSIKTEEQLDKLVDFFKESGYLDKIQENYNSDKITITIRIDGYDLDSKSV